MYKNVAIVILLVFITLISVIIGLPLLIYSFNVDINLIGRIVIIVVYTFLILLMYYLKKNNRIDLITTLSYSKNFDTEKNSQEYLTFMFNTSLMLFLPTTIFLGILQFLDVNGQFDFCLLLVSLFIWISLGYKKSEELS